MHNDYFSGGLELARRTGAGNALVTGDRLAYDYQPVVDGDVIEACGCDRG